MRPGIGRISGIRAKDTRSGIVTALLVTAIGSVLLSLSGLSLAVALPEGTQEETVEAICLVDTRSRGNKGDSCSHLCASF